MDAKEFLKPDWKKFILPVILLIIYIFLVNYYSQIGNVLDEFVCDQMTLATKSHEVAASNDTEAKEEFMKEAGELSDKIKESTERLDIDNILPTHNFMKSINPFMPVPCEFDSTKFCMHYSSQESYDCVKSYIDSRPESEPVLVALSVQKKYKKLSLITHILNVIFLFTEGYLVSVLIILGYKKGKEKIKIQSLT